MVLAGSTDCDLVLIGGQIGAGKTAVAVGVATATGGGLLRVRDVLENVLGSSSTDRRWLQIEGAALDRRTGGRWLLHYLDERCDEGARWVIDAARTRRQIEPILETRVGSRLVYLAASEMTRRQRFALSSAADPVKRSMGFEEAMRHSTEREARTIAAMAHVVVETDDMGVAETVSAIVDWLQW